VSETTINELKALLEQVLETNKQSSQEKHNEIVKIKNIVTGNGNPERGVVFRLKECEKTLESIRSAVNRIAVGLWGIVAAIVTAAATQYLGK
jgi:hypothetical protein